PRGSASRRTARVACTPDQGRPPASLATAAQPHRPPPVGRSDPEGVARSRRRRAAPPLGSSQEVRRHGDGARAGRTSAAPAQPRTVLGDRDRGSQHPTALTASPSRARDASTRLPPSASQPPRRGRRPTANCESTGRLARARGGASGRPGLWETSASGTAAIATLDSAGPRNWTRQQKLTPGPSIPESRLPSLCRPPSEPDMLEHLSSLPTQMDYKGQKLAEQMFQGIILFSAIVGFIYGYLAEQFGWTVYIVMAGFAFSCLLTLPPWPIYRRHPLKWLPVQDSSTEDKKPGERKVPTQCVNAKSLQSYLTL
uniref:Signal peptidase complex subunit 1 n=1 Tax=Bos taurus TaxID=9913 RepID=A0AAA9TR21_BOVIN